MIYQNLHCHTTFDDGRNTPEEMVQAAVNAGLTSLGISAHSDHATIQSDMGRAFRVEMQRLKAVYADKIKVFCGLEYELSTTHSFDEYDYVIGSVHFLSDGQCIDDTIEESAHTCRNWGGSDSAAEEFYRLEKSIAAMDGISIVGHFDLLTKYDERIGLYDTCSPRYREAAYGAMEELVRAEKIFEINTGAISRGYRTSPYPSAELLRHLKSLGGRITISSDAHSTDAITCSFALAEALAHDCGFTELWQFDGEKFAPIKLT